MKELFLVPLLMLLLIPVSVQGQVLTCNVRNPSCLPGETDVFHTSDLTNAHAELNNQSTYSYKICCGGVPGLGTDCSGGSGNFVTVVRLDEQTDATAERGDYSNYGYQACLSVSSGNIYCEYDDSGACSTSGYSCVAELSDDTNAHMAECGAAETTICCSTSPPPPPEPGEIYPLVNFTESRIFIVLGESYHARVDVTNNNESSGKVNLSLSGSYPESLMRFLESSAVANTSSDWNNVTVQLRPHERKSVYMEIMSTDPGMDYEINVTGISEHAETGMDSMSVTIGFPAAFPALEIWSILAILGISLLIYWKRPNF
jgi:hypothetical protein